MKKYFLAVLGLAALTFTACGDNPYASGKTLADINGKKVTEGDLEFLSGINPNIARQLATPFGKKQILNNLVDQEILYQAAKKEGLQHDPKTKAKIELYRKVILAQAYIEKGAEEDAKKYYKENPAEFEKLRMSHIMINYATPEQIRASRKAKRQDAITHTEKEALTFANKIYEELTGGADFGETAKKYSEDPRTKERGGDLGAVSRQDPRLTRRGFQPLLDKVFTLKVGEIAGPIKTASGYHLITMTAPAETVTFDEIKTQLLFKTRSDVRGKILGKLKEKYKVSYADEAGPSGPAEKEDHLHYETDHEHKKTDEGGHAHDNTSE